MALKNKNLTQEKENLSKENKELEKENKSLKAYSMKSGIQMENTQNDKQIIKSNIILIKIILA